MAVTFRLSVAVVGVIGTLACSGGGSPTMPSPPASAATAGPSSVSALSVAASSEQPPFDLEAILRGDGFGHVKFRQQRNATANVVTLDVWVRDLSANSSYSLHAP